MRELSGICSLLRVRSMGLFDCLPGYVGVDVCRPGFSGKGEKMKMYPGTRRMNGRSRAIRGFPPPGDI